MLLRGVLETVSSICRNEHSDLYIVLTEQVFFLIIELRSRFPLRFCCRRNFRLLHYQVSCNKIIIKHTFFRRITRTFALSTYLCVCARVCVVCVGNIQFLEKHNIYTYIIHIYLQHLKSSCTIQFARAGPRDSMSFRQN